MAIKSPDSLERLRAANPAPIDPDRGASVIAQAGLQRILTNPGSAVISRSRRPRRVLVLVVLLAALVAAGAAVAATDPFGWWSPNPDTAMYGINPTVRVITPSQAQIVCPVQSGSTVRCAEHGDGQRYLKIDAIKLPAPNSVYSRQHFLATIAKQLAAGNMTDAQAARFRTDLAHVPDSFFSKLELASRFGTYSTGSRGQSERVPPPGVSEFLICTTSGTAVSCRDLNGDTHAPVGAGVYLALQAPGWKIAPSRRRDPLLPGITFTNNENQLLDDLIRTPTQTAHTATARGRVPTTGNSGALQPRKR